jgi:hypothetical protein
MAREPKEHRLARKEISWQTTDRLKGWLKDFSPGGWNAGDERAPLWVGFIKDELRKRGEHVD